MEGQAAALEGLAIPEWVGPMWAEETVEGKHHGAQDSEHREDKQDLDHDRAAFSMFPIVFD
ncbi:MAG: hypothetical protein MUQ00_15115 [Candidatus Aminicenantes bacterium]|nr:hypothetical protein [Candidatus Aminicenantes bacterium]